MKALMVDLVLATDITQHGNIMTEFSSHLQALEEVSQGGREREKEGEG